MAQDNFNIGKFLKESVKNTYTKQVAGEEEKELLNENFVGLEPINAIPPRNKEDYELAFDKYLGEEVKEEETHEEVEEDMQVVPVGVDNKVDHSNHGIDDEGSWLQVLKDEFKSYESKDYDFQDGLSQCKTRKGCFVYGKIIMVEQILDKEI